MRPTSWPSRRPPPDAYPAVPDCSRAPRPKNPVISTERPSTTDGPPNADSHGRLAGTAPKALQTIFRPPNPSRRCWALLRNPSKNLPGPGLTNRPPAESSHGKKLLPSRLVGKGLTGRLQSRLSREIPGLPRLRLSRDLPDPPRIRLSRELPFPSGTT